jgi:uncharacterized lipoprotein YmbA
MTNRVMHVLVVAGCWTLAACSSSPPTRYYVLNAIVPAAPVSAMEQSVPVRVQPIAIPAELDRAELVSHEGPNRVRIMDSDRWAAPLDQQIRDTVSEDLAARLPGRLVADPNEPASTEPRRLLSIAMERFDADGSCTITLRAAWTLRGPGDGEKRGAEDIRVPGGGACPGAAPAAMSQALATLADRLAAAIAAQDSAGASQKSST